MAAADRGREGRRLRGARRRAPDPSPAGLSGALRNLRRFFPLGLPVALDAERAVFVYAEPGHDTVTALRSGARRNRELWKALWDRGRKPPVRSLGTVPLPKDP